ncbi:MAG: DUF4105 domain-containing protein [Pseudomonadota bacterium]
MIQSLFLIAVAASVMLGGLIVFSTPKGDREWSPALAQTAVFEEVTPFTYHLKNLRRWEYAAPDEALRKDWADITVKAEDLSAVWFFIEPFGGNPVFAHSLLSFVFDDGTQAPRTISVSVEARKESGEPYSALLGALRAYELSYVWSTEKDVLSRIAVKLDHQLFAYKLNLTHEQAMLIFDHFVKRTNALAKKPRFYNTLHSNCTNELAKVVNEAFPKALPWHRSWVLTGKSGKWLHDLSYVGREGESFAALKARSDIQDLVKEFTNVDTFSQDWRSTFAKREPVVTSQK